MKANRLKQVQALTRAVKGNHLPMPIYRLLKDPDTWFWLDGSPYQGEPLPPMTATMTFQDEADARAIYSLWSKSPMEKVRINYGIQPN